MSDQQKPLADKRIEKAKNNPVVTALVLLGFMLLLLKPIAVPMSSIFALFKS